ncbi:MAG: erythromycin esterase family protein [Longimicrobiaceae bacterium]
MPNLPSRLWPWLLLAGGAAAGVLCAAVAYLVAAEITSALYLSLPAAAAAFLAGGSRAMRPAARRIAPRRPRRFALAAAGAAGLAFALLAAAPTVADRLAPGPGPAGPAVLRALRSSTVPLRTVRAGSGFDDLRPLKAVLRGRRIVALGEASHGTGEFFRMKHRMLEFLVREMGFRHFAMELSPEDGRVIDAYIHGAPTDPRRVLYWPWATVEVMEMIEWMRAYNAERGSAPGLTFHGIDPRSGDRDPVMAANVSRLLARAGPEAKVVLWAHNAHISRAPGWTGSYLKREFGDQAYLLGFELDHGRFTSRMSTVRTYGVGPAPPSYYAHALARLGAPILFLDFRTMERVPELRAWLREPRRSHELQELHAVLRLNPAWHTLHTPWPELYDGLIFVEESTPAVGLSD